MLPYKQQLQYKQKQVEETLKRIGKIELPPLLPIVGAEETKFYRNKLEYTFSNREFLPEHEFKKIKAEIFSEGSAAKRLPDEVLQTLL